MMRPGPLPVADEGALTLGAGTFSGAIHLIDDGVRHGYEPAVAAALGERLGLTVRWEALEWAEFYPSLDSGRVDAILYNQAVTDERRAQVDFTHPYGIFHEAVLVRETSDVASPGDLRGCRLAALADTSNMRLAQAIDDVEIVPYELGLEGFNAMLDDVRSGAVEGLVDDEMPLEEFEGKGYRVAFVVKTANPYAMALRKGSELTTVLDEALADLMESGDLERIWNETLPGRAFERPEPRTDHTLAELRRLVEQIDQPTGGV